MSKRGQIAIFILIGVVLLGLTALFLFYSNFRETGSEVQQVIEQAPLEAVPVQNFITSCLGQVSKQGIKNIAEHGGYIDFEKHNLIPNNYEPTEAKVLEMLPGATIPYWHYLKSPNNCLDAGGPCTFGSERPPISRLESPREKSIEFQLARYIEDNIEDCLDDFEVFKEQGMSISVGEPLVLVDVMNESVNCKMKMTTNITSEGRSSRLENFNYVHSVPLMRMYELAKQLAQNEHDFQYIDKNAINLIIYYSGFDQGRLPPMHEFTMGQGNYRFYLYSEVKRVLSDVLGTMMPLLQVQGTRNFRQAQMQTSFAQSIYNGMIVPDANITVEHGDLSVRHMYLDWPIYFETGRNGELIEPENIGIDLGLIYFGIRQYNMVYDVSFPVAVVIEHKQSFGGEGLVFNFAIESNIRGNEPLFIDETAGEAGAQDVRSTLFLDPANRNSGPIRIAVSDGNSSKLLSGVNVLLESGNDIGLINVTDSRVLVTKLPSGFCGNLRFTKQGYLSTRRPICITSPEESKSIDVVMWPFKNIKIDIRKIKLATGYNPATGRRSALAGACDYLVPGWALVESEEFEFHKNESAIVSFKRIRRQETGSGYEGTYDDDFPSVALVNISGPGELPLGLVPGYYEIKVQMWNNQKLSIPARQQCTRVGFGPFARKKCVTIPQVDFNDTYPSGGIIWAHNESSGTGGIWIAPYQIYDRSRMEIRTVNPDYQGLPFNARVIEDLDALSKIPEYALWCGSILKPRFVP